MIKYTLKPAIKRKYHCAFTMSRQKSCSSWYFFMIRDTVIWSIVSWKRSASTCSIFFQRLFFITVLLNWKKRWLSHWSFGFKLHLICNERGKLQNFMITPGDVDDRKSLEYKSFVELVYGKLVGYKGYIGKNLFERLFVDGMRLITKLKSNMKGALIPLSDKLLLRKWAIIETVNDEFKI